MQYRYKYRVKISDLWQASMYYAYSSYMGVVNIVCIAASIILIISRWKDASDLLKTMMVLFLMLFTVIQPSLILLRAHSSLKNGCPEIELTFSQSGMTVISNGQKQFVNWQGVLRIVKKPTILLIYMEDGAGYILRNSVLKDTRKELYVFVSKMLDSKKEQA